MRGAWLLACLLPVITCACGRVRECAPETLLVPISLPPGLAAAAAGATLDVDITVAGATRANRFTLPTPVPAELSVEISFPGGYPTGLQLAAAVALSSGAGRLAEGSGQIKMDPVCGVLAIALGTPSPDAGAPD